MSDVSISVVEGSPHRVVVVGDIDFATAHRVTEMLCELSGDIKVDCEEVTFIDTAGFDALDWGYVVATARGHTFAVVGLRDFQARVAELLRVPYGRTSRADSEHAETR
jgi:anti-anti-sigma regulatory factor